MKRIQSAPARRFQHDIHQYRARLFSHFANSIEPIAKALPDLSIIIRPHPSESSLPWLAAAKGLPNVCVSKEGSVIPWIMGSMALIHNGCTTALEARLLGQQVISYRPIVSTKFDIDLPNRLGVPADDVPALIHSLKDNAAPESSGALREDEIKNLSYYIAPQTDQLCCERIVNALIALDRAIEIPRSRRLKKLYGHFSASYRRNRKLHGVAIEGHKNSATYNRSRFPSISTSEVAAGVAALGNCLNRFDRVMVKHLKENIFELHQSC